MTRPNRHMWEDIGTAAIGVALFAGWAASVHMYSAVSDLLGPIVTVALLIALFALALSYQKRGRRRVREQLGLPPRP
jgi:hypothetical protein